MIAWMIDVLSVLGITRGQDKVLHFIAGFIVGAVGMLLFGGFSVIAVIAVAIGKELYDEFKYGGFDFFDMFATLVGGWVGIITIGLIGL